MLDAARIKRLPHPVSLGVLKAKEYRLILILAVIHIPLGILLYNVPTLGLVHQVGVFSYALYCAWHRQTKLERVALVVAYIIGAEVLWRMAGVSLAWELGKFVSASICVAALVWRHFYRVPLLPVVYFLVLIPGCLITLSTQPPESARAILSSTMSGPFFLLVACYFFSHVEVTKVVIRRMLAAVILPLLSIGFVTLFYTMTLPEIQFTGESNFATSGGFGPNQVSAMLGAGAFAALLLLVIFQNSFREMLVLSAIALFLTAQSVMTFSRGGIYNALGAILATALVMSREPKVAVRRLAPLALAALIFLGMVFPFMDDFTGGSLRERFEDTQGTNRTEIVEADLNIFFENPIFGVGVGAAYDLHEQYLNRKAMSHTEFSRLLAEHGLFGLVALVSLVLIAIMNIRKQTTIFARAFVVGIIAWSTLFMTSTGMRLAAPSFMVGLTFITIVGGRSRLRNLARVRAQWRLKRKRSEQAPKATTLPG